MAAAIRFNLTSFERAAKSLGGACDQVPFALARSLNDAAEVARQSLITDTWPAHIRCRNRSFLKAALTTRGNRATKTRLRVAIVDKLDRAALAMHADGGTKTGHGALAVPSSFLGKRRGARGIPAGLKPRNLPNSFRKGDVIYQRPKSRTGKLILAYVLKRSTRINKDVPFREDFRKIMLVEVWKAFTPRLAQAMATRK